MSLKGTSSATNLLRGSINSLKTLTLSAYAIAVQNGFEGTEQEWLASLKGEKGDKGDMTFNGVIPDDTGNIEYPPRRLIAPEQGLAFDGRTASLILSEPLVVGNTYKVVWGDEEYICKCYDKAVGGTLQVNGVLLGNASLFIGTMPDTGEPFFINTERSAIVIKSAEDTNTMIAIYIQEQLATEEYVRDYVQSFVDGYGVSSERIAEVKLLAASWVGDKSPYSQVVTIPGITNYSQVDLTPSVEQLAIFYDKDITFVTENDGGVVTVYVIGQKPQNDYTIQANIVEVIV